MTCGHFPSTVEPELVGVLAPLVGGGHPLDTQIESPMVFETCPIQRGGSPAFPSPALPPLTFLLQNLRAHFLFWHLLRIRAGGPWGRGVCGGWRVSLAVGPTETRAAWVVRGAGVCPEPEGALLSGPGEAGCGRVGEPSRVGATPWPSFR